MGMHYDEWQVAIQNRPAQRLSDIYIIRDIPGNKIVLWSMKTTGGKTETVEAEYETTDIIPPSFTLPRDLLEPLLDAILARGIKPAAASFTEGKLEATEYHLEDMRQLLKLKNITNGKPGN